MKTAHTPTPWHIIGGFILSATGKPIIEKPFNDPDGEGNLALIVSAVNNTVGQGINPEAVPDMLAALQFLLADYDDHGITQYSINRAREALNKAKGE